jgi:PERQ amino acid-rich with GYF domain-containing protein
MNGATQTFRRPSSATNVAQSRESSSTASATTTAPTTSTSTSAAYIPPHLNSAYQSARHGHGHGNAPASASDDCRYSKDQLLTIFKSHQEARSLHTFLSGAFIAPWNPLEDHSPPSNGAAPRKDDVRDSAVGPDVCWLPAAHEEPLALLDMTADEKEVKPD